MSPRRPVGRHRPASIPRQSRRSTSASYWRLIAARWWLVRSGSSSAPIVGYSVSLGGSQTLQGDRDRLSRPAVLGERERRSSSRPQTNPSTVRQIAHAEVIVEQVARECKAKPGDLPRWDLDPERRGEHREERPDAARLDHRADEEAPRRRVRGERAREGGRRPRRRPSRIRRSRTSARRSRVTSRTSSRSTRRSRAAASRRPTSCVVQIRLAQAQSDKLQTAPAPAPGDGRSRSRLSLTGAPAQRVTARSRRNTVVVAALIGIILGAIAALMWDGVAAGMSRRRGR